MNLHRFSCASAGCKNTWLVILRVAIGWHFLYEGVVKLLNPNWTSVGYLLDSKGLFSFFFRYLASSQDLISVMNFLNEWGLTLVGLSLILGLFTRLATISAMALLVIYYLSHPPFIGLTYALPSEGSYLFVDKIFIEFCALGVLSVFPTGQYIGIDRLIFRKNIKN